MPVDKSDIRVRRMFAQIAGRYDFLNHLLSANIDRYWRWRAVRNAPPDGQPILDLCTGTGDLALAYFRRGGVPAQIVAADFCHEMLVIGERKGHKAGAADKISWIEADAQMLPFDDESFGIVSVAFGLRNVSDTMQGLSEMVRVCRPSGKVVVLEFSLPTRQPIRALYGWYFRRVLPRIGQFLASNRDAAYNYLPSSVSEFPQGAELVGMMREAGLSEANFRPLTFGIATLYVGIK